MSKLMEILKKAKPESDFENSNDFLNDRLLDSLSIVNILTEIEDVCNIEIEIADLEFDDFKNIDGILNLVKRFGGNDELLR